MPWPAGIYFFKVSYGSGRKMWGICSKLTVETEWRHWRRSGVFIVNWKQICPIILLPTFSVLGIVGAAESDYEGSEKHSALKVCPLYTTELICGPTSYLAEHLDDKAAITLVLEEKKKTCRLWNLVKFGTNGLGLQV